MSVAELRGKLSPESAHDRMEDLLTSDVFGTFYYIGWHEGFQNWLLEAQPTGGSILTMQQFLGNSRIQQVFFKFWPLLPNGREPDLALLFPSDDGTARVLIVEVKYQSGPSDFDIQAEDEVTKDLTGSQLIDQMIGFARADQRSLVEKWFPAYSGQSTVRLDFAHLLITTDRFLPRHFYKDASQRLPIAGLSSFPCPVFWLSWRSLARNLEPYSRPQDSIAARLIADLVALLERKEITDKAFEAFRELTWAGMVPCQGFWRRPSFFSAQDYGRVATRHQGGAPARNLLSDRASFGFWQQISLFNDRDYSGLAPPNTTKSLANLFWKERL